MKVISEIICTDQNTRTSIASALDNDTQGLGHIAKGKIPVESQLLMNIQTQPRL